MKRKGGDGGFVHLGVQRLEAGSVAKQVRTWCSGAWGIARRSWLPRRRRDVDEAREHLGNKHTNERVTEVRHDVVKLIE